MKKGRVAREPGTGKGGHLRLQGGPTEMDGRQQPGDAESHAEMEAEARVRRANYPTSQGVGEMLWGETQQQNPPSLCGMVIREVSQAPLPREQCCCS